MFITFFVYWHNIFPLSWIYTTVYAMVENDPQWFVNNLMLWLWIHFSWNEHQYLQHSNINEAWILTLSFKAKCLWWTIKMNFFFWWDHPFSKYAKFSKKANIFDPLIPIRDCAHTGSKTLVFRSSLRTPKKDDFEQELLLKWL